MGNWHTMLFTLAPTLDLASADDLHREIASAFVRGEAITLDASTLKVVDLAGLQLLYATHAAAAERGLPFAIEGAGGQSIEDAAQAFGFPARLGCVPACPCGEASGG